MIEVIDNFLDDKLSAKVEDYFEKKLPWYFIDNISIAENEGLGNYGFYHVFVINNKFTTTEHLPAVEPVISKIQEKVNLPKILRVRADKTVWQNGFTKTYSPHTDFRKKLPNKIITGDTDGASENFKSVIYYINDSSGDTIFFKERQTEGTMIPTNIDLLTIDKVVTPKRNRLVIFDGDIIHTGQAPITHNFRHLLNLNFDK